MSSFTTGRVVIGLVAVLVGLQTLSNGHALYDESLNDLRKTFMPSTLATQPVCSGTSLTWEELNRHLITADASLYILAGLLILLNARCTGGFLLMLAALFIVAVKDFPGLRHSALKSTVKERNEKLAVLMQNLSVIGAALLIMSKGCQKKIQ